LVDELGVIDAEVFEAMRLASGKRAESTLLAIGTPPREPDSIMRTLVEHGRRGDDPTFALVEYSASSRCAVDDRKAWKKANPALGDFLYEDGMATEAKTVRESTFRQFRLGQWVGQPDEAWMPSELWASAQVSGYVVDDGADMVLALDGSFSQDCTALVACSLSEQPHLFVVGCWENPRPGNDTFRIDVQEVEEAIRTACRRWNVLEVTADPYRWTRTLQVLQDERIPVSEFPQSPSRMTPATTGLYEAVVNHAVTQDGDLRTIPARRERGAQGRLAGHQDREGAPGLTPPHRPRGRGLYGAQPGPASRQPAESRDLRARRVAAFYEPHRGLLNDRTGRAVARPAPSTEFRYCLCLSASLGSSAG
jgi:hypothetical protein